MYAQTRTVSAESVDTISSHHACSADLTKGANLKNRVGAVANFITRPSLLAVPGLDPNHEQLKSRRLLLLGMSSR